MKNWTNSIALAALAATFTLTAACTDDTRGLIAEEDRPGPESNPYLVYDIVDSSCPNGTVVSPVRFATLDDRDVFFRDAIAEKPYMMMKPRADLVPGSVPTWKTWQAGGETVVWVTIMGRPSVLGSGPDDVGERLR